MVISKQTDKNDYRKIMLTSHCTEIAC